MLYSQVYSRNVQSPYEVYPVTTPDSLIPSSEQLDIVEITNQLADVHSDYMSIGLHSNINCETMQALKHSQANESNAMQFLRTLNLWKEAANQKGYTAFQALEILRKAIQQPSGGNNRRLSKKFESQYTQNLTKFIKTMKSSQASAQHDIQSSKRLNLAELCQFLKSVEHKAIEIGAGLGLSIEYLDTNIRCSSKSQTDKLFNVLEKWQQTSCDVSLEKLINVLKQHIGGHNNALAMKFKEKLDKTPNCFMFDDSQVSASEPVAPPYLDRTTFFQTQLQKKHNENQALTDQLARANRLISKQKEQLSAKDIKITELTLQLTTSHLGKI